MATIISKCSIIMTILFISFGLQASSQYTGIGTINAPPYVPSACYGYQDMGVMIAAASEALWDGGAVCGKYFEVTCTGGTNLGTPHPCSATPTVTVVITDFCPPPGCKGDLDLSHESFSAIADPAAGGIKISYQQL
ncbi:EG45-like domain containing protein [Cynara cardunculus var. scolymus]|uniref:EG45-like domain containing protein n=1 Tax=Cynara cardunculus var. scolymus TaxID=59895 RepID=UPI000D62BCD1|nr:EG45-like domain containing protein [Cynara cardunculus var. scolymus]